MKKLFLLACLFFLTAGAASAQRFHNQKVIGYIPDYRDGSSVDYDNLTHAIFCFLFAEADGSLTPQDDWTVGRLNAYLQATEASGSARLVALTNYGGKLSLISRDPLARTKFCDTLAKYCQHHGFQGVDLDWEGLGSTQDSTDYKILVEDLSVKLAEENLTFVITVGFGDYACQWFPTASLHKAEWLQIMAYDAAGTWSTSPMTNHSSFNHLEEAALYWEYGRGFNRNKLVMGLPLYGYKFASTNGGIGAPKTYAEIAVAYPNLSESENRTPGTDYTFFNGPALIRRKCQYLIDSSFAGVFMWEMGQDAVGAKSLHRQVVCTYNGDCVVEPLFCGLRDVQTGLIANYLFDGNTLDATTRHNDGISSINLLPASDRFGNVNGAYRFGDQQPSRIDMGTGADFSLHDFTFSAWVKLDETTYTGIQSIVQKYDGYPGSFAFFIQNKKLGIHVQDQVQSKSINLLSQAEIKPNEWYHVLATHSASYGTRLYINGTADNEDLLLLNVRSTPTHQVRIGGTDGGGYPFMGVLDDLRIYNRALDVCGVDSLLRIPDLMVTSNNKGQEASRINVYPNPNNGTFTVSLNEQFSEDTRLVLSDVLGNSLKEMKMNSNTTSFQQELPEGLYLLTVWKGDQKVVSKVIVQKTEN